MSSQPSQKKHKGDGIAVSLKSFERAPFRVINVILLSIILLLLTRPLLAGQIRFDLPVKCTLGKDCFIQNYFDHGTGDYTCGKLTYRGHHGTDVRLKDMAAMREEVPVLAAASGVVKPQGMGSLT